MEKFLSCDWGTSTFRLRLIDAKNLTILAEENSAEGIAQTFQLWNESGKKEGERQNFYLGIISKHIKILQERAGISLDDLPLIISGMASSSLGIVNLPYKTLPFCANGEDLETFIIEKSEKLAQKVIIISGAKTDDDVMRGEETKLVGLASENIYDNHIYIFPGTHPKHIEVKNGKATAFKTFMTGEFFELLSKKSILSVSVKKSAGFEAENNLQSFAEGVTQSQTSNLLHSCFLVRTNDLFKKKSAEENYFYLSGLLIGAEMNDLRHKNQNVTIVGNTALNAQYTAAFRILNKQENGASAKSADADEALIKGQIQIYERKKTKN